MMEDSNEKILREGYGLKLYGVSRSRAGVLCKTDRGLKELRKTQGDEKLLLFESCAKEHIYHNGFPYVDRVIPALSGQPFYSAEGVVYVLSDYVPGQPADSSNPEHLQRMAEALAEFHNASEGFQCAVTVSNLGKLPMVYRKRKTELSRIRKWIGTQSTLSKVDLLVMQNYSAYKSQAERACQLLDGSPYQVVVKKAEKTRTLCHNNFKNDNVRVTEQNQIFVSGFQKCAYDCTVADLSELIRRYLKNEECSVDVILNIMNAYQKARELSAEEKEVLFAMLTFPYKFLKLCNQFYNKRRVYVSDAIIQKMERCIERKQRDEALLKDFFDACLL